MSNDKQVGDTHTHIHKQIYTYLYIYIKKTTPNEEIE